MSRNGKDVRVGKRVGNNLEAYRRLVELQKQMIELAQKHEQARRECEALRAQIEHEVAGSLRDKRILDRQLRAAVSRLNWFNRKESLPC
jgi:hypothetical protein